MPDKAYEHFTVVSVASGELLYSLHSQRRLQTVMKGSAHLMGFGIDLPACASTPTPETLGHSHFIDSVGTARLRKSSFHGEYCFICLN
jgi:hypothetical protein